MSGKVLAFGASGKFAGMVVPALIDNVFYIAPAFLPGSLEQRQQIVSPVERCVRPLEGSRHAALR